MIRVCLCYNNHSELLKGAVQKMLSDYPKILFEAYNENFPHERKKSYTVKSYFAAKMTPFCGVFNDNSIIKGFYSEVNECTEQNISKYLSTTYDNFKIELSNVLE